MSEHTLTRQLKQMRAGNGVFRSKASRYMDILPGMEQWVLACLADYKADTLTYLGDGAGALAFLVEGDAVPGNFPLVAKITEQRRYGKYDELAAYAPEVQKFFLDAHAESRYRDVRGRYTFRTYACVDTQLDMLDRIQFYRAAMHHYGLFKSDWYFPGNSGYLMGPGGRVTIDGYPAIKIADHGDCRAVIPKEKDYYNQSFNEVLLVAHLLGKDVPEHDLYDSVKYFRYYRDEFPLPIPLSDIDGRRLETGARQQVITYFEQADAPDIRDIFTDFARMAARDDLETLLPPIWPKSVLEQYEGLEDRVFMDYWQQEKPDLQRITVQELQRRSVPCKE